MVKMVPRGFTAAADAYLTPHIMRYILAFQAGFDAGLANVQVCRPRCHCVHVQGLENARRLPHLACPLSACMMGAYCLCYLQVLFMQSDGGLARVEQFSGHKAILSGPAGGYVGYALTTKYVTIDVALLREGCLAGLGWQTILCCGILCF